MKTGLVYLVYSVAMKTVFKKRKKSLYNRVACLCSIMLSHFPCITELAFSITKFQMLKDACFDVEPHLTYLSCIPNNLC